MTRRAAGRAAFGVAVTMSCVMAAAGAAPDVEIHIAPTGGDRASGDASAPLETLEAARDRIRKLRAEGLVGRVDVIVHGGVYFLRQPLRLTAQDSGSADGPVVYRAAPGQSPRLVGGRVIRGFAPLAEADRARLPEPAWPHVRVVDLKAQGATAFGKLAPVGFGRSGEPWMELFFNGEPMRLAGYPNAGWLTIASTPDAETFIDDSDRPARWGGEPDGWLYGYWYHGWADQFLPIRSIDPVARRVQVGHRHHYGLAAGARYRGINLLCELDAPGEYYIDREAGRLFFWPPALLESGEAVVSELTGAVIELNDVSHLTIEGLTIEAARGDGVRISGGQGVTLRRCTLRNLGDAGVVIRDGRGHRVIGCEVAHTGGAGIVMQGGDRAALVPAGHEATDNRVHHVGRIRRTYTPAFLLGGVGHRVAHNLVHDAPHSAVLYGGNDHVIELNEMHHVLLETDDAGAVYIGRDWTARGHVLRHNYIHHSGPAWAPPVPQAARTQPHVVYEPRHVHGVNLLYHDDAACGITAYGNVLHGGHRGLLLGGGRDNITRNNVFIGCDMGVWIDARAQGWARDHAKPGGGWGMYEKLKKVNHDQPPYSVRYPALARILDENPPAPLGNVVDRNLFIGVEKWLVLQGAKQQDIVLEQNLHDLRITFDEQRPIDVLRSLDAQLLERIGFETIPVDRIGPRTGQASSAAPPSPAGVR